MNQVFSKFHGDLLSALEQAKTLFLSIKSLLHLVKSLVLRLVKVFLPISLQEMDTAVKLAKLG